jgi:hypothetical protein
MQIRRAREKSRETLYRLLPEQPCVVVEESNQNTTGSGIRRSWYPVRLATSVESHILTGRPTTQLDSSEGTYIDEEGNVYQLKDKGATQPIAVEHLPGTGKTELETLLEVSLNEEKASGQTDGPSGSSSGIEAASVNIQSCRSLAQSLSLMQRKQRLQSN